MFCLNGRRRRKFGGVLHSATQFSGNPAPYLISDWTRVRLVNDASQRPIRGNHSVECRPIKVSGRVLCRTPLQKRLEAGSKPEFEFGKEPKGAAVNTMSEGDKFQDLEETGETLVSFINSSRNERLRRIGQEQQAQFEKHRETKLFLTKILKSVAQAEENAGQKLLDMEEQKQQRQSQLEDLEEELRQKTAKSHMTESELQFLQRELETLKKAEQDLQTLQEEVDEDTTEIIPSAIYVSQIYYHITKIKWEYDTQPNILKGVHYGAELATPINIDTSLQSASTVSNRLWDFVSTQW